MQWEPKTKEIRASSCSKCPKSKIKTSLESEIKTGVATEKPTNRGINSKTKIPKSFFVWQCRVILICSITDNILILSFVLCVLVSLVNDTRILKCTICRVFDSTLKVTDGFLGTLQSLWIDVYSAFFYLDKDVRLVLMNLVSIIHDHLKVFSF